MGGSVDLKNGRWDPYRQPFKSWKTVECVLGEGEGAPPPELNIHYVYSSPGVFCRSTPVLTYLLYDTFINSSSYSTKRR